MEKNQKILIELGIVLVLVVFGLWSLNKSSAPATNDTSSSADVVSVEDTSAGSINVGAPAASIAYGDALVKYKDARLQLNKDCQGSPDKMTFKNGANVMIDNRSAVARTVKVGSVFSIKAYGFKIVNLSSSTLPATWYVDCGTSQNVATITIQK